MKKFLKVLAAAAAVAAVIPYKAKADENGGEVEGLFWKATWSLDPDYQSEPDVNITFGFNNPFENLAKNEEKHLFADDLMVDYCCDETLVMDTAPAVPCEEAPTANGCTCGENCDCDDDCDCGDNCTCKE